MLSKILIASLIGIFAFGSLGMGVVSAEDTMDCGDYYTVQSKDSLSRIAVKCDVPYQKIIEFNPQIKDTNLIYSGQIIYLTENATPIIPDAGSSSEANVLYTVKAGDSLSKIAARYRVSLGELMAANPEIDSSRLIYTGQLLTIPLGTIFNPVVSVSPNPISQNGVANLLATGFPPNGSVEVGLGIIGSEITPLYQATTDSYGRVSSLIPTPTWVRHGESYVFVVYERDNHSFKAVSNTITFQVPDSQAVPGSGLYIVKPNDNLSTIALRFNTTIGILLQLNPEITNSSIIYRGQVIKVPKGTGTFFPTISISDLTPIAGQTLSVYVSNFPVNVNVDIRLYQRGRQSFEAVVDAKSNGDGEVSGKIQVPDSAKPGEFWEVRVKTTELENNVHIISPVLKISP